MLGLESAIKLEVDNLVVYFEGTMGLPILLSHGIYLKNGENLAAVALVWGEEYSVFTTDIIIGGSRIYWYRLNIGKIKIYHESEDVTPKENILGITDFFFSESDRDNFLEERKI